MSLPAPVEKIAEAAGPASGAITPFRRSPERDATAPEEFLGASAPKSFATAPRLIAGAPSGTAATSAGATNTHVQCASWKASNNTMAATASVPKMPLFTAAGGWGAVAIWKLEHALVPGLALEVDVEVEPRLEAERMLLVVEEPGLKHDVLRLVGLHHPRHVDHDQLHHALVEGVSLRAVRHELRALIERVVLGKVEHGVVGLPDGALPQELQEVFPVGIVGDPAVAERLHLAELRLLPQLRQLLGFREGHADADVVHRLLPQLVPLALALRGNGAVLKGQGRAVRVLAIAVAVQVDEAEHVEERLGLRRVVLERGAHELRVVSRDRGRQRRLRARRLVLVEDRDLLVDAKAHGDCAPQRHALGRIAAHAVPPPADGGLD